MSSPSNDRQGWTDGWRGVCLVAITYVYFLIFAQFAFLKRLDQLGIIDQSLQAVMGAMAAGGIGFSLLAARRSPLGSPRMRLQLAFCVCGAAALCALLPLGLPASIATALLIGCGLGLLTVTLVAHLGLWIGSGDGLLKVALGTGLGYFLCNLPALFTASPTDQARAAACLCGLGVLAAAKTRFPDEETVRIAPPMQTPFAVVLLGFTALVWLDSAAFFIIQNTPTLKSGTWEGTSHLWANACLHLAAAVLSGVLLRRRGLLPVLALAVLALAAACLLLHPPGQAVLASLFYPVGVSLYSVALVAYPSLLAPAASPRQKVLRAGLIYAIAGWFGSAMGIGMAQHLRQVPLAFVAVAAVAVLGPRLRIAVRAYPREFGLTGATLLVAFGIRELLPRAPAPANAEARGRQVYVAEGCIHCHSQYVRPHTADDLMWGPDETMEALRAQHPPLIGNRRQGPDLSQVGGRRSPLWLKAHFFNPGEVSHASFMPSYAALFRDSSRGDDLIRYLSSLKSPRYPEHLLLEQAWQPAQRLARHADPVRGGRLYGEFCATCHDANGATRMAWAPDFKRLPPDLARGPWLHVTGASGQARVSSIARIIKFGVPMTDMPGHEALSDDDIAGMAAWLNQSMDHSQELARFPNTTGENR